jgi:hypothetical protein
MTSPVCPTGPVTPGKDVCNTCLMNGCDNCLDRCIDSSECNKVYTSADTTIRANDATVQVSISSDNLTNSETEPDGNDGFPGFKYVCSIEPDQSSYKISGTPTSDLLSGDSLYVSVSQDTFNRENGQFMATASFTDGTTPNVTYSSGSKPSQFESKFDVKTSNDSFKFLQDIYAKTFSDYVKFHNENEKLAPVDFDFHSLRNLDPNALARNLFTMVKGIYKIQMLDIQTTNYDRKAKQDQLNNLRQEIDRHRVVIEDLKATNSTSKRNIEINLNKSRRVADTNNVLMIVMIIIGLMIIIPILKKAKLIPLTAALGIWVVLLLVVLGYMVYELYMKRANYDELEYKKRNFAKPTDKEIAKSRALAQMSNKDKARCQAFSELEEELDVPNININPQEYYSADAPADSCAHIPEDN